MIKIIKIFPILLLITVFIHLTANGNLPTFIKFLFLIPLLFDLKGIITFKYLLCLSMPVLINKIEDICNIKIR